MAEKGFGVKEINLIGASGTPTIESPNNLNLNAVNVAISTNATIGGNLTVSGTVGIAGTLTYEDVTNIDAVGVITARSDISIADKIIHTGDTNTSIRFPAADTFTVETAGGERLRINSTGQIITNGGSANPYPTRAATFQPPSGQTNCYISIVSGSTSGVSGITFGDGADNNAANYAGMFEYRHNIDVLAYMQNGSDKILIDRSGNINITGIVTATNFVGDGSNITGIAVTEAPVTDYTITADSGSNYYFHGGGVDETDGNPDLYLIRGQKYRFNNTTGSGHPFAIRVSNGGSAYTDGVSGSNQGIQFFTVPYAAPSSLVYQCTIHGGMVGNIYIRGGSSTANISNNANNRIITGGSGGNLNGEANLTFTGQTLTAHMSTADPAVFVGDSNRTGAGQHVAEYRGYWDGNQIGRIVFAAGDDTTNKDDGIIKFHTTPSGGGITERLRIKSDGNALFTANEVKLYNATDNSNTYFYAQNTGAGNAGVRIKNQDGEWTIIANDSLRFRDEEASADRLLITSVGNIVFKDSDSGHTGGGFYSRTKTCSGNSTTSFMRFVLSHGALAGAVYATASNNARSIAKSYTYAVQYGDGSGVNLQSDSGDMGGTNFSVDCSTSANQHDFRVTVTGSNAIEVNLTVVVGCANQDITYTEL